MYESTHTHTHTDARSEHRYLSKPNGVENRNVDDMTQMWYIASHSQFPFPFFGIVIRVNRLLIFHFFDYHHSVYAKSKKVKK